MYFLTDRRKRNFTLFALSLLMNIGFSLSKALSVCQHNLIKSGCFKRNEQLLPELLATNRDTFSSRYTGETLNWHEYADSTLSLLCYCSKRAVERNFKFISINFFGTCFGGNDMEAYRNWFQNSDAKSTNCVNVEFESCDLSSGSACTGRKSEEFIYLIEPNYPSCQVDFAKVGCFQRNTNLFSTLLANNGLADSETYIGKKIDWLDYGQSLHDLACNCSHVAYGNYQYIAINSYGYCYGSSDTSAYNTMISNSALKSTDCLNWNYQQCDLLHKGECSGKGNTDYVYVLQPTDGGYSSWSSYTACNKPCGGGTQTRSRSCNNPPPRNGGKPCQGDAVETIACNTHACVQSSCRENFKKVGCFKRNPTLLPEYLATNRDQSASNYIGTLLNWQKFGESMFNLACYCSEKAQGKYQFFGIGFFGNCFGGNDMALYNDWIKSTDSTSTNCVNENYEPCDNNSPGECAGRSNAEYVYILTEVTLITPASVDGGFSNWTSFSYCSKTCGGGIQKRNRTCDNPVQRNGGKDCIGDAVETRICNTHNCPVDGGFLNWSAFSNCTKLCGRGTQQRYRTCDKPIPQNGGSDCAGDAVETKACNTHKCPDGGFSNWTTFSLCTSSCGGGTQFRSRYCKNPSPGVGGKDCEGDTKESKVCNTHPCKVNGGFSVWSAFSVCTKPCGGGTQQRTRTCDNPKPQNGGKDCIEVAVETMSCNTDKCRDGGFSQWTKFSVCTSSCGGGSQMRYRYCNNPPPGVGGKDCEGASKESGECNTHTCKGDWSCFWKSTPVQSIASDNSYSLIQHKVNCLGRAIHRLQLFKYGDYIRYTYRCCATQVPCQDTEKWNPYTSAANGDTRRLTQQSLQCNDEFISKFQLSQQYGQDSLRYVYGCCQVSNPKSCYNGATKFQSSGQGKASYLTQHLIECRDYHSLTFFQLQLNPTGSEWRYAFRCCSVI